MMKKAIAMVMSMMVVFSVMGCGADSSSENGSETAQEAENGAGEETKEGGTEDMRFALFLASVPNETTTSIKEAAEARAEELGFTCETFIGNDDQNEQVSQIETCITEGYDGLMIEPITSDGCLTVMKEAKDAGIPVVTVMQDCSDPSLVYSHIGADHKGAGKLQMEQVCKALGGKGKIAVITGVMGSTGQIQLSDGYEAALENYPDIEVVEEQDAEWLIDNAMSIAETWLQKYDDLDAIVAQSDQMALGALQACKDMGVEINISGRDAQTAALKEVADGSMFGTVSQNSGQMGTTAVDVLLQVIDGEEVEDTYFTDNVFVNSENVTEFQ